MDVDIFPHDDSTNSNISSRHMSLLKAPRQLRLRTTPTKWATFNDTNFLALALFDFTQYLAPHPGVICLGFRAFFYFNRNLS